MVYGLRQYSIGAFGLWLRRAAARSQSIARTEVCLPIPDTQVGKTPPGPLAYVVRFHSSHKSTFVYAWMPNVVEGGYN